MMFSNYRRRHRGFTLLELIVVIVILGILAVIAIPTFAGVLKKSQISVLETNGNGIVRDSVAQMRLDNASDLADYLPPAASEYVNKSSAPANAAATGTLAAGSSGVIVYADASAGIIQVYNPNWNLCVQASPTASENGAAPAWSTTCRAADPAIFSLMVVVDPSGQRTGKYVAPYVPGATSWSTPGQTSSTSSPVITVPPSNPAPTVTVATPSQTAVYSPAPSNPSSGNGSTGSTGSAGSTSVPITVTSSASGVTISWTLQNATAASGYSIFRSMGAGSTPVASGTPYGAAAQSVTSWTDTGTTAGTTYCYAMQVTDSYRSVLTSNSACTTTPAAPLVIYTATIDSSAGLNPGQVINVTENGVAYSYTVAPGETDQSLIDALNSAFWPDVTASGGSGTITLTDPQDFTVNATGGLTASAVTSS